MSAPAERGSGSRAARKPQLLSKATVEPRSGEFAVTGSATPEPVKEPVKEPSAS